jgi:hypothetical protein
MKPLRPANQTNLLIGLLAAFPIMIWLILQIPVLRQAIHIRTIPNAVSGKDIYQSCTGNLFGSQESKCRRDETLADSTDMIALRDHTIAELLLAGWKVTDNETWQSDSSLHVCYKLTKQWLGLSEVLNVDFGERKDSRRRKLTYRVGAVEDSCPL